MDLLKDLQEFIGQIMDNSALSEKQQEERIIQVVDLYHFICCYKQSLTIIDCMQHNISLIDDEGIKKGVYFCDLVYDTRYFFDELLYESAAISAFKNQWNVKELWFVFVEELFTANNLTEITDFIERNNVDSLYDKIFHCNFYRSIIKILK
jgi:hypothetical protein